MSTGICKLSLLAFVGQIDAPNTFALDSDRPKQPMRKL